MPASESLVDTPVQTPVVRSAGGSTKTLARQPKCQMQLKLRKAPLPCVRYHLHPLGYGLGLLQETKDAPEHDCVRDFRGTKRPSKETLVLRSCIGATAK